jgi:hypothetical protein
MAEDRRLPWTGLVALALGILLHPAFGLAELPRGRILTAALSLGLALSLASFASRRPEWLLAAGAVAFLIGQGYDSVRGHQGHLTLAVNEAAHLFDEEGPGGASLGLRPLGFEVRLAGVEAEAARLVLPGGEAILTKERALSVLGARLGRPTLMPTGEAARLVLSVTAEGSTREIDLEPPRTATLGKLEIALDRYFADFALSPRGEPFSRSPVPRNPAALLRVTSPQGVFPMFVIRALPGIHEQPGVPATFALLKVEPQMALRIDVFEEPFLLVSLVGLVAMLVALGLEALQT